MHPRTRRYFLEWYGVEPPGSAPLPNCSQASERWHPLCRNTAGPEWCSLQGQQKEDAPNHLMGMVPCSLFMECKEFSKTTMYNYNSSGLAACLHNKRIVSVGDSVVNEMMVHFCLFLAYDIPEFVLQYLTIGYKKSTQASSRLLSHGPVSLEMFPNSRNFTFRDSRINLTVQMVHSGALHLQDHGGLRTLTHPEFASELIRLGLHPHTTQTGRPDIVVTGASFHDDVNLGTSCDSSCSCNSTWSSQLGEYIHYMQGVASLLALLQRSGTSVVWMTLFPRGKQYRGGPDFLRAVVDQAAQTELERAGFVREGGRIVDQWPVYRSYFQNGNYGPSSLHTAPLTIADCNLPPDLVSMRTHFLLDAICTAQGQWEPRCGMGSQYRPQAAYVTSLNAQCSCARYGLSIFTPHLCNTSYGPSSNFFERRATRYHPSRWAGLLGA
eukprot:6203703-Pleurochrysis_carterae.AAC.3